MILNLCTFFGTPGITWHFRAGTGNCAGKICIVLQQEWQGHLLLNWKGAKFSISTVYTFNYLAHETNGLFQDLLFD